MKADEVEPSSNPAVRIILLVSAMLQKCSEKLCRIGIGRARRIRPPDSRLGESPQHGLDGKVIKLEVLVSCSFPIRYVGFIPDFPQPGLHLGVAVTLMQMVDKLENQLRPLGIVLRRIGPSRVNG